MRIGFTLDGIRHDVDDSKTIKGSNVWPGSSYCKVDVATLHADHCGNENAETTSLDDGAEKRHFTPVHHTADSVETHPFGGAPIMQHTYI